MVTPINNPCDLGTPEPCGVNPAFKYTRYPCDFDDPRPTDTRGLPLIVDLQTPVKAEVANRHRESILALEAELGIQPSGSYTTVRNRLDVLENFLCTLYNSGGIGGGGGGTGGYEPVHEALTVSSNGQVNFTLSQEPTIDVLLFWIGGIKQAIGEYTLTDDQVTWTGSTVLQTTDIVEVLYFVGPGTGGGDGGGGLANFTQQVFTAVAAQTNFVVSNPPQSLETTQLYIDGISQTVGTDYSVFGSTVIYAGSPALTGGEEVVVKYFF